MSLKILAVLTLSSLFAGTAFAQETFVATLHGPAEVPFVVSTGIGHARITISEDQKSISYELTYTRLQGSLVPMGKVLFAHIHVGKPTDSGGVALFFCDSNNTPRMSPNECPQPDGGTVTGTWTAADLVGPTAQGVDPKDDGAEAAFERVIKAIRTGFTYANVHTTRSPGGEIRGQIRRVHEHD